MEKPESPVYGVSLHHGKRLFYDSPAGNWVFRNKSQESSTSDYCEKEAVGLSGDAVLYCSWIGTRDSADVPWVNISDEPIISSGNGIREDATVTAFAGMQAEDQMQTHCHQREASGVVRGIFRSLAEAFARIVWNEPITVITRRQFNRLRQLERREELKMAERSGDDALLDEELQRVQLTADDLARIRGKITPIDQWPDENFEDCFDSQQEPTHSAHNT